MRTILFLGAGPAMPHISKAYVEKYEGLSKYFKGFIVTPASGEQSLKVEKIGDFIFRPYPYYMGNTIIRNFQIIFLSIVKTLHIRFVERNKIDVIITHSPLTIGLITILLGKICKAKTIIEINGNFADAFKYNSPYEKKLSPFQHAKESIGLFIAKFCIMHCNLVRLLFPSQLAPLHLNKSPKAFCFPDFVPCSIFFPHKKTDEKFIFLLGFPWYLKGVDVLIKAFKLISPDFPEYSLKIYGWNPSGREYFENLAKGNDKIFLGKELNYNEVIEIMTSCSLYIQASRTEGIARVLIEAMASQKPIIATNVGGTSSVIKDGVNGFLFENENIQELANKIRLVLSDYNLRNTLSINASEYAKNYLSENNYINSFYSMVETVHQQKTQNPLLHE